VRGAQLQDITMMSCEQQAHGAAHLTAMGPGGVSYGARGCLIWGQGVCCQGATAAERQQHPESGSWAVSYRRDSQSGKASGARTVNMGNGPRAMLTARAPEAFCEP
jgi:hypothetical protein